MRKLIASINITLDGFYDHNATIADDELHENVNNLFRHGDTGIIDFNFASIRLYLEAA